jgi:hypothetical protein
MKLHGIMPFAFLAVSTPTIVPAGALEATVKLLIVIVMSSPVCNEAIRARHCCHRSTRSLFVYDMFLTHNSEKVNHHIAYIAFMDGCLRVGTFSGRVLERYPDELLISGSRSPEFKALSPGAAFCLTA